jgi:protein-L-isoaspartate(D-aspartate) O-methyltransferase
MMEQRREIEDDASRLYREQFVSLLEQQEPSLSPSLLQAFTEVPRHAFITQYYRRHNQQLEWQLERVPSSSDHREAWQAWYEAIYADEVLVTQISDQGWPTSSSTQPSVMAMMLEALDLRPGHRVLEIGSGTGYNAAIMAHLVGDPSLITSVELDPNTAVQAKHILDQIVGSGITVHIGNGLEGYAAHAPYHRIIATASHLPVVPSWVQQLAPGGILLMDLRGNIAGAMLRLEKSLDGQHVHGRFLAGWQAAFMPLRSSWWRTSTRLPGNYQERPLIEQALVYACEFSPECCFRHDFALWLQWAFPTGSRHWRRYLKTETQELLFLDHHSETVLRMIQSEEAERWRVEVYGQRFLWTHLREAYQQWQEAGCPGVNDYTFDMDERGRQIISVSSRTFLLISE